MFRAVGLADETRDDRRSRSPRPDPANDVALEQGRVHEVGPTLAHEVGEPTSSSDAATCGAHGEQLRAPGLELYLEAVGVDEGRDVELDAEVAIVGGQGRKGALRPTRTQRVDQVEDVESSGCRQRSVRP